MERNKHSWGVYRLKSNPVVACRWFKNGDHIDDCSEKLTNPATGEKFLSEGKVVRRFRHPDVDGFSICEICGHPMNNHGWIDQTDAPTVHPGDVVVTDPWETLRKVYNHKEFMDLYEKE